MYPKIFIPSFEDPVIILYTFGIVIALAVLLFIWMFRRMVNRKGIDRSRFPIHLPLAIFIAFFGSRIVHIISYWGVLGKASFDPRSPISSFFFMTDFYSTFDNFYLSLSGILISSILLRIWIEKKFSSEDKGKISDSFVLAFLFASIIGYLGAFFGGQIYGFESSFPGSVSYSQYNPKIGEEVRFPIGLIYSFVIGLIFSALYIFRHSRAFKPGSVTALGSILFGAFLFIAEFFNAASSDIFRLFIGINLNQIVAVAILAYGVYSIGQHKKILPFFS